jgi:hypothetical protein
MITRDEFERLKGGVMQFKFISWHYPGSNQHSDEYVQLPESESGHKYLLVARFTNARQIYFAEQDGFNTSKCELQKKGMRILCVFRYGIHFAGLFILEVIRLKIILFLKLANVIAITNYLLEN